MVCGERGDDAHVDEGSAYARGHAPLEGHRHHAVHDEDDEDEVPRGEMEVGV